MSLINKLLSFLEKGVFNDLSVSMASILKLFTLYTINTRAILVTTHTHICYFSVYSNTNFKVVHFIDVRVASRGKMLALFTNYEFLLLFSYVKSVHDL